MKNKTLVSLEIAIVFCLLFLVALPGIATATEDETLDIYGNANEDDIIDMRDLTFTARMILRLEDETDLKIVTELPATAEGISLLGAWDRVVGRPAHMTDGILFPGVSDLPVTSGTHHDVYYETVFELDPDIFLTGVVPVPGLEDIVATLEPEIPVVALNFFEPHTLVENTRKLRYILNTEEKGEEFIAFYEGVIDDITEKTAGLSEEVKPKVFLKVCGWTPEALSTFSDTMPLAKYQMEIAGGINIADEEEFGELEFVPEVDQEWLIGQNPDIVVAMTWEVYHPGALGYDVDDTSVAEATREQIMAMDVFAGGKAVEEGKVYLYENRLQVTPRFVVFIAYMAKWFHPTLFSDLDPKAICVSRTVIEVRKKQ
jgi:iron complex transport system substrate-binding protein